MIDSRTLARQEGYTLVETLVALSLFAGVVLFLVTILGFLSFDSTVILRQRAFVLAQENVLEAETNRFQLTDRRATTDGYFVERNVERMGELIHIRVRVGEVRHPERVLVSLSKTVRSER